MAKSKPLTLADLNLSLQSSDLKMNPAVASQLQGALGSAAPKADDNIVATESGLSKNLNQLAAAIRDNTSSTRQNTAALNKKGKGGDMPSQDLSENQLEDRKERDYQTSLLEAIAENTGVKAKKEEKKLEDSSWGMLGAWGLALAAAIGSLVGIITAQFKVMRDTLAFMGKAAKFMYGLLPESFRATISKSLQAIPNFFKDLATKLEINLTYAKNLVVDFFKNKFAKVFIAIENGLESAKAFFSRVFKMGGEGMGKVVELFSKVVQGIKNFFAPIGEAFTTIKNFATPVSEGIGKVKGFFTSISEFFTGVGNKLSAFGKVFGAFKTIVGKLAYPITVIMGIWDGIKGAMEGYKNNGVMGGIEGFISGVLKSVVGSLLDLVKSAVSWILGALGFDQAEKFLDSFSFSDMIKNFIHAIFHPIETIKSAFQSIMNMLSKIEIPGIDFNIFGKNFKFGPWKPFDGMGGPEKATPTAEPPKVAPPPAPANDVYQASGENEMVKVAPKQSAPITSVVNAPTTVTKQTQNNMIRTPTRNQDTSINSYYRSRYAV